MNFITIYKIYGGHLVICISTMSPVHVQLHLWSAWVYQLRWSWSNNLLITCFPHTNSIHDSTNAIVQEGCNGVDTGIRTIYRPKLMGTDNWGCTVIRKLVTLTPHPPIAAALWLVIPVLSSEKTTSHETVEHIYCCCCYTDVYCVVHKHKSTNEIFNIIILTNKFKHIQCNWIYLLLFQKIYYNPVCTATLVLVSQTLESLEGTCEVVNLCLQTLNL